MKKAEITISTEHAAEFLTFCRRNHIPCACRFNGDGCIFLIRDGIDLTDAKIMALKMGWTGSKTMDYNAINLMVIDHNFQYVRYNYECYPISRVDEDILDAFVFP